ncbi:DUF38 domain-containing protein [Caenorhabditis elegans]|uniref:DUF38 domain-containing protein n=1 Tax=Caenorhabditis elegans TaxID=6239 RepID=D9N149_CAEEL|nr:DUF38 domain-containing protein [Caenorhabditis elegans]CBO24679.1 DUF38 domain-containing protein [Caenorhabditis elegans]|eukprot:NP_001256752.1 Uncharacterized protein CELE_F57G4.10 [Caenorhabditis elegans]
MKIDDIELRRNRYEEIRDRVKQWSCANVETLMLGGLHFNEVAPILASFGVEKLLEIKMDLLSEEIDVEVAEEVAKLEQWKSTKVIDINESCKLDLGIAHFLHFHAFSVALKRFTVEDAVIVRDNLIKSADFESADIHVQITGNTF